MFSFSWRPAADNISDDIWGSFVWSLCFLFHGGQQLITLVMIYGGPLCGLCGVSVCVLPWLISLGFIQAWNILMSTHDLKENIINWHVGFG